jgi:anaerobic selenocysteine-containing dehydrogenase
MASSKFYTPSGKAKFLFDPPAPLPEPTTNAFPFTLLTGRGTSAQWYTQSRTSQSPVLRKLYPGTLFLDLNPMDAEKLGINDRNPVTISSKRASITAPAHLTTSIKPSEVYLPMHEASVNRLTLPSFDPHSRQPSYKACAVRVSPVNQED